MKSNPRMIEIPWIGGKTIKGYVSNSRHRSFRNKGRYDIPDEIYGDPEVAYLLIKEHKKHKRK